MAIDYSKQFSPRRGSATTMATTKKSTVLAVGELFIEYPDTGVGTGAVKVKIGDGTTTYENLPYALSNDASASTVSFVDDTSETVAEALAEIVSGEELAVIVPALKQAINILNGEAIKGVIVDNVAGTISGNTLTVDSADYSIGATSASGGGAMIALTPEADRGKIATSFNLTSTSGTIGVAVEAGNVNIEATPTGAISAIYDNDLTANYALISSSAGKVVTSSVTNTELGYLSGVTSSVQDQLNGKQPTVTGAATTIVDDDLTGDYVLVSTSAGKVGIGGATTTEVGYLSGVTAAVQTQLNGKSDINHNHNLDDLNGQLDVTKLWGGATSAKIDIDLIPHGAIENLYVATDETAIRALTKADVQNGDVVKNQATGVMYFVAHDNALPVGPTADLSTAFEAFVAGSVEWSAITNKPATFPPSAHTHVMAEITDLYGNFSGATTTAAGATGFVPAPAAGDEAKYLCGNGSWVAFTNATSAAAGLMSAQDKADHDDMVTYFASTSAFDFGDEG